MRSRQSYRESYYLFPLRMCRSCSRFKGSFLCKTDAACHLKMAAKCKLASLVLVAVFAYVIYTPQPHYWTDTPLHMRLYLSFLRRSRSLPGLFQITGLDSAVNVSRKLRKPLQWLLKEADDVQVQKVDDTFDQVPVRVYIPKGAETKKNGAAIFHIHGGAFIFGDVATYDGFCSKLSETTNTMVVSVEYRRAPEHVFPASLDDCERALRHFAAHAAHWHVDAARIAIFGDSAGANLAAALAIRLRDSKQPLPHPVKLQVLIYPLLQMHNSSMLANRLHAHDFMLTRSAVPLVLYLMGVDLPAELHQAGFANVLEVSAALLENNHTFASPAALQRINQILPANLYDEIYSEDDYAALRKLPEENAVKVSNESSVFSPRDVALGVFFDRYVTNPELAPLLAPSLSNLPPAYIIVCEHDMLRDEALLYAARLKRDSVATHVQRYQKYHSYVLVEPDVPLADFAHFLKTNNSL